MCAKYKQCGRQLDKEEGMPVDVELHLFVHPKQDEVRKLVEKMGATSILTQIQFEHNTQQYSRERHPQVPLPQDCNLPLVRK